MKKDNIFEFPQELKDTLDKLNTSIREMTDRLQPAIKAYIENMSKNEDFFNKEVAEYENYFKGKNLIYTTNFKVFWEWFLGVYCEGANDGYFENLTAHHFKLYHEYKVRMFTGKWSDEQEIEYLSFDSNDATNPLIFSMDMITGLHNNFRSYIFEITDIDTFKNYFRKNPMPIKKREGITISELCYLFGKIEYAQTGISNFAEWMKFHIGKTNYGSKKNELIEMKKNASERRSYFSLTAPQQKALANKDKIDNLLNQMHTE